jgi:hypothetical protein
MIVGLILGFVGIFSKNTKKSFAIAGIITILAPIAFFILFLLLGGGI